MDSQQYDAYPEEKKGMGGCLKFFLIALGIGTVLVVVGGWWLANNWKGLLVGKGLEVVEAGIDSSDFPEAEKAELKSELQRLRGGVEDGTISNEQLMDVVTGLPQSPLMDIIMVSAIEVGYVQKSGLSEDEKVAAKVTLARLTSGMATKKISKGELENLMTHISDPGKNGNIRIREKVTDEELRKFLTAATEKVDAAGVSAEPEPVDPSDELKKVIDAALLGEEAAVDEEAASDENVDEQPVEVQDAA